ncbi:MAG: alpha/beta hydrolase [Candidatus Krumholzibacteriia bacterium]
MDARKLTLTAMVCLFLAGVAAPGATGAATDGAAAVRQAVVTAADGVPIHYTVQGAGEPAVVFIHGWSCDGGYWAGQVEVFGATHRVVAVDLAGHGASGTGRADHTIEAFGRDVAAVLEAEGIDDAVLVGHSMGGPVAVEAALAAPARVRGVIGIDNFQDLGMVPTEEQIAGFTGMMQADFSGTVEPWVRGMFPAGADSALVAQVAGDMAAASPAVGISALGNLLRWFGRTAERLGALPVNLTTVSGDLRPTDTEGNRTVVPGFAVRIVPGTGHFPMLEKTDEFNAALAAAVAEFGPRPVRD